MSRALQRGLQLPAPLWYGESQPADQVRQTSAWQGRVGPNQNVDQCVDVRAPPGGLCRSRPVHAHGIDADAALASYDAQQAAIVQVVEQMRRGTGQPAPVIRHGAVREMPIDFPRVNDTSVANEFEERLCAPPAWPGPSIVRPSWVHQDL